MSALFNFEVHTPYRLFYSGKAEMILLTLLDGEIAVYAGHSPFTAPCPDCILRFRDEKGAERAAFISGGILEVKQHKNVLMVDAAEWPEEIDRDRALAAKQKAEEDLGAALLKFEVSTLKTKLRRAECRLKAWELGKQERR